MKKIILIEDDFDTQILYSECLEVENFDVHCADHGPAALEHIREAGLPDLIVLDLNFPEGTPQDFLSQVRRQEGGEKVPVIVISGDAEIQEKTAKLGAQDCLKKPFGIDPFVEIVKKWI